MHTSPSMEIRHIIARIETSLKQLSQEVDYWEDEIKQREDKKSLRRRVKEQGLDVKLPELHP